MIKVTVAAIFICRIFSVGLPVLLVTLSGKKSSLKMNEWSFVYFGGLIRGAIAFGLSLQMTTPNRGVLKTTTQIAALITTIGIGSPIQLLAKCFKIKTDQELAAERGDAGNDDNFAKVGKAEHESFGGSCSDEN